jgi:TRAP-type C4-dicarboxylate transport system permease small subunit
VLAKRFWRSLEANLEEFLVVGLLVFLVCSVATEVFRRYVLNNSGEYSEEIARYALIWMVYLGVPYAIKQRRHIICDVLPSSLPRRVNLAISLASYGLFLGFSVLMVYENYQLVMTQMMVDKRTEAMHAPIWYFSSGVGIGFALASARLLQAIWHTLRAMRSGNGDAEWAWHTEAEKGFD